MAPQQLENIENQLGNGGFRVRRAQGRARARSSKSSVTEDLALAPRPHSSDRSLAHRPGRRAVAFG